jgi:hypothetical protein
MTTKELEKNIQKILERNHRVELEKSWETSKTRMVSISVTTFIFMSLLMKVIGMNDVLANAFLATISFFLSTLSMSFIKKILVKV